MKYVRLENNIVREIIPHAATVPCVAHWYGEEFAAQCVEAPDEVEQRWVYDAETETYSEPPEPEPGPEPPPSYDELMQAFNILTGGADDELD